MNEPRITLEMSLMQARVLSTATELVSRLYMGQLDVLDKVGAQATLTRFFKLTAELFPELEEGQHHGIRDQAISDNARVLYDICQVIRHHLAWRDQPKSTTGRRGSHQMSCNFDEPFRTSTDEKQLITIKESQCG